MIDRLESLAAMPLEQVLAAACGVFASACHAVYAVSIEYVMSANLLVDQWIPGRRRESQAG